MKNKPAYSLGSVDNALLLLHLLRDQGRLRVSEAARELGIARSTAHRLLAMLVYRDFAVQDDNHDYLPGPSLAGGGAGNGAARELRRTLLPHMETLCEQVGETVNLSVRTGTRVRFIASVESARLLHVGDRTGTLLPAHLTSGGKVLLAELGERRLRDLYRIGGGDVPADTPDGEALSREEWDRLLRELEGVRSRGYSLNNEQTEQGVCAVGACVRDGEGEAVAGLSIAVPSARFAPDLAEGFARRLHRTARQAGRELGGAAGPPR
ncbi:IclR family transcriptional regulator [Allosalinactinospora lopnorensis]|uniref:IclR family transcriptional regulator n=1 Tax=Allosalinactinospora lopnorensis TaxID=1352348 RepID=UPI000623D952|nr:IclR family transcriptional regulator [Allosalinactinospora lopnorensis]